MNNYIALLDANVMVSACLRDTLLRQAEEPRLFLPKWSDRIIQEVVRALENRLGVPSEKTQYLVDELTEHFPEASVSGFEPLIEIMQNDPKDRHVLAAAVHSHAETIVTFNVRHFPKEALDPWGIAAQHPDDFLVHQYHLEPTLVKTKLGMQAGDIGRSIDDLLLTLKQFAPQFVELLLA